MIGSYVWPAATLRPGDTVIPKDRLLAQAGSRRGEATRLRQRFVEEVARITRPVFLDPNTTNLPATVAVPQINVLRLTLRRPDVHASVLTAVDRAVPGPTLLELVSGSAVRLAGAYKRPSDAGTGWVTGLHTVGEAGTADAARPLPTATDLTRLYAELLGSLWTIEARPGETLADHAARVEAAAAMKRALAKAERTLRGEVRYCRKVELNREVREMRGRYEALCAGVDRPDSARTTPTASAGDERNSSTGQ